MQISNNLYVRKAGNEKVRKRRGGVSRQKKNADVCHRRILEKRIQEEV